jgi:hypothetical protein
MPSVDVEKEIYVDMVGVFEALTVFLEQQALRIIDLALESFEKPAR